MSIRMRPAPTAGVNGRNAGGGGPLAGDGELGGPGASRESRMQQYMRRVLEAGQRNARAEQAPSQPPSDTAPAPAPKPSAKRNASAKDDGVAWRVSPEVTERLDRIAALDHARIIDEHFDGRGDSLLCCLHCCGGAGGVGDITRADCGLCSRLCEFCRCGLEFVRRAAHQQELGALGSEDARALQPHATPGAGDQYHATV